MTGSTKTHHLVFFSGMNNREVIDQVERGYRMAQPSHITYPESKTQAKDVANAQGNVYKVMSSWLYFDCFKIIPPRLQ